MASLRPLTALLIAGAMASAQAEERPRIGIHLVSHHAPSHRVNGKAWENVNPGIYARWDNGVTAGFYRNSRDHVSTYGGWTWMADACGPALTLGLITGYGHSVLPLAVPSLCVLDHFRVSFIPRIRTKDAAVLHLSVEF